MDHHDYDSLALYLAQIARTFQLSEGAGYIEVAVPAPANLQVLRYLYSEGPLARVMCKLHARLPYHELSTPEMLQVEIRDFDGSFRDTRLVGPLEEVRFRASKALILTLNHGERALSKLFSISCLEDPASLLELARSIQYHDGSRRPQPHLLDDFHVPSPWSHWSGIYPRYEELIFGALLGLVSGILLFEYGEWRKKHAARNATNKLKEALPEMGPESAEEVCGLVEQLYFEARVRSRLFQYNKQGDLDMRVQEEFHKTLVVTRKTRGTECPNEYRSLRDEAIKFTTHVREIIDSEMPKGYK